MNKNHTPKHLEDWKHKQKFNNIGKLGYDRWRWNVIYKNRFLWYFKWIHVEFFPVFITTSMKINVFYIVQVPYRNIHYIINSTTLKQKETRTNIQLCSTNPCEQKKLSEYLMNDQLQRSLKQWGRQIWLYELVRLIVTCFIAATSIYGEHHISILIATLEINHTWITTDRCGNSKREYWKTSRTRKSLHPCRKENRVISEYKMPYGWTKECKMLAEQINLHVRAFHQISRNQKSW